ncbi:MAG: hypothetical protein HC799_05565 [Limnothrix sp. RL_2_0]|nr:hypothetical protein [Limnothrix sp. RL_2_0]
MAEKVAGKKSSVLAIAVIVIFAVGAFFLTRPVTGTETVSSVSGLMSLQVAAQQATPYNLAIATGSRP